MRLRDLIKGLPIRSFSGNPDLEVTGLSYDSRSAGLGEIFVAIPGTRLDGHQFITQARDRGVVGFLVSREVDLKKGEAVMVVDEPRLVMGILASRLAGEPSQKMEVIGITGTNGKTTTSYLIEAISRVEAKECGVIGTINYRWNEKIIPATNTTPESVEIIKILSQMLEQGIKRVAMEVSSHALSQKRVAGICFRAGIFTNLTPEHLDYHKEMDDYFEAKSLLFREVLPGKWLAEKPSWEPISVINLDDPYGKKLIKMVQGKKVGYSLEASNGDYQARILESNWQGLRLVISSRTREIEIKSPLLGRFNAYNILSASACLMELGTTPEAIIKGVASLKAVPGRLEQIENPRGILVVVDYAHTPDALEKAISAVKELGIKRLILVFGCGGDRDRSKRPKMGEIGARASQILILTSDNPRSEDPLKIISEIESGVEKTGISKINHKGENKKGYLIEPDRRSAIALALEIAREGDAVLIAGKGHEDYQIIGDQKIHFDDREEVRKLTAGLNLKARD